VSREFSDRHPEIPWADIIGMRHKVVHDYLGIDEDIVWQVVTKDLPSWWPRSSESSRRRLQSRTGNERPRSVEAPAWPPGDRVRPQQRMARRRIDAAALVIEYDEAH
jgi:Protein of unknown function DUF86